MHFVDYTECDYCVSSQTLSNYDRLPLMAGRLRLPKTRKKYVCLKKDERIVQ